MYKHWMTSHPIDDSECSVGQLGKQGCNVNDTNFCIRELTATPTKECVHGYPGITFSFRFYLQISFGLSSTQFFAFKLETWKRSEPEFNATRKRQVPEGS